MRLSEEGGIYREDRPGVNLPNDGCSQTVLLLVVVLFQNIFSKR